MSRPPWVGASPSPPLRLVPREDPPMTPLEQRAAFAYLDQRRADEAELESMAAKIAWRILEAPEIEVTKYILENNIILFNVDGFPFRAQTKTVSRSTGSNSGVQGIHEEEVHDLHVYHQGTWHPIFRLSDLGHLLHKGA